MEASEISSASLCICCVIYEPDVTISQEIQYEIITSEKLTDTSTVKRCFCSLRALSASHFTFVLCAHNSATLSRYRPWKGLQLPTCVTSLRLAFVLLGPKHNIKARGVFGVSYFCFWRLCAPRQYLQAVLTEHSIGIGSCYIKLQITKFADKWGIPWGMLMHAFYFRTHFRLIQLCNSLHHKLLASAADIE